MSNIFKDGSRIPTLRSQNREYLESGLAGEYECLKSKSFGREEALVSEFLCVEENHEY